MATSKIHVSSKETNFLRIVILLNKLAPLAVRRKFDQEFHHTKLQSVLHKERFKILEPLKHRRVINQKQWSLLFPNTGTASSNNFDVTLMICLLRNLANIPISDILPLPTDTTDGADLSRIKYYRNEVVHCDHGELSDASFKQYWNDICEAIIRLGGHDFKQQCEDLSESRLDKDPIPVGVRILIYKIIEEWESEDEMVMETRAVQHLWDLLQVEDILTTIGSPGSGKSTAVHHVALKLRDQGYEIVPVQTPELIIRYFNPECKQVFIIDDVCGIATVDLTLISMWMRYSNDIKTILKDKSTKIITSSRTYLVKHRMFENLQLLSSFVDLNAPEYCLTNQERQLIAKCYLSANDLDKLKQSVVIDRFDFFPLLCKLYSKHKTGNIIRFFSDPVRIIKDELMIMMKAQDQTNFAVLFLFLVYNNCISDELLSSSSGIKTYLEEISDECEIPSYLSLKVVKSHLDNLTGTYVRKSGVNYCVIHDKIFDIMVSFYGEHTFQLVLDICHTDIIRDRFLFEGLEQETDKYKILVPNEKQTEYFERLLKEVSKGCLETMFLNSQIRHGSFRNKMLQYVGSTENIDDLFVKFNNELSVILLSLLDQVIIYDDLVRFVLTHNVDVNVNDWWGNTPLHKASLKGLTNTVELILNQNYDPNAINKENETPLFLAAEEGHTDIVKLLLESKQNPDISNSYNITPVNIASQCGHTDVVKLLVDYSCNANLPDIYHRTPLYVATKDGFTEIVEILLSADTTDLYLGEEYVPSPLEIALETENAKMARFLIQKDFLSRIGTNNIQLSLFLAVVNGYIDIMKMLLNYGFNILVTKEHIYYCLLIATFEDTKHTKRTAIVELLLEYFGNYPKSNKTNSTLIFNKDAFKNVAKSVFELLNPGEKFYDNDILISPLYLASRYGFTSIVKLLLKHNFDTQETDVCKQTPLYMASKHGHRLIVKYLLRFQSDPNTCNEDQETALHVASREGHARIVKILLENKSDCNIKDSDNRTLFW